MNAINSDTAGRAVTRVDLGPARQPADTPRAKLHRLAARGIALLRGDQSRGARLVLHLCRSLSSALSDLTVAEHRQAVAERAVQVLDRRLSDARADLADERTRHAETAASYRALLAQIESFEVETAVRVAPLPPGARPTAATVAQGER